MTVVRYMRWIRVREQGRSYGRVKLSDCLRFILFYLPKMNTNYRPNVNNRKAKQAIIEAIAVSSVLAFDIWP